MTETGDGYVLSKTLIHALILSILASLVSIGAYMIKWNASDLAFKQKVQSKLEAITSSQVKLEVKVDRGILPQAKWRLDSAEAWIEKHQEQHRRLGEKFE